METVEPFQGVHRCPEALEMFLFFSHLFEEENVENFNSSLKGNE